MTPEYEARLAHLPPELAAAVREFIAWSDKQLLAERKASTPKRPLYHYTDETALKGILTNEHLWCFGHRVAIEESNAHSVRISASSLTWANKAKSPGGARGFSILVRVAINTVR